MIFCVFPILGFWVVSNQPTVHCGRVSAWQVTHSFFFFFWLFGIGATICPQTTGLLLAPAKCFSFLPMSLFGPFGKKPFFCLQIFPELAPRVIHSISSNIRLSPSFTIFVKFFLRSVEVQEGQGCTSVACQGWSLPTPEKNGLGIIATIRTCLVICVSRTRDFLNFEFWIFLKLSNRCHNPTLLV